MGFVVSNNYMLGANLRSDPNLDHRRPVTKGNQPAQSNEIFVLQESIDPQKLGRVPLWQLQRNLETDVELGDANIDYEKGTLLSELVELNYGVLDGQVPPLEDLSISQSGDSETLSSLNTNAHSRLETHEILSKSTPNEHLFLDNSSRQLTDYVAAGTNGCIPNLPALPAIRPAYRDISDIISSKEDHQPLSSLEPTYFQNFPPSVDSLESHLAKTEHQDLISSFTQRQVTSGVQFSHHEFHLKYLENSPNHISIIIFPNELGRIIIDINRDKTFSIRVRADRAVTKELLQEHLDLFLSELNLDGILDADVYFDNSDQGGERFLNNHPEFHLITSTPVKDRQSHSTHHVLVSHALSPQTSLNLRL